MEQQHQIEDKYINTISMLIKDLIQKGLDLPILAGMLLNADEIIQKNSSKKEVWQEVGEKFLRRAKNKYKKRNEISSKN